MQRNRAMRMVNSIEEPTSKKIKQGHLIEVSNTALLDNSNIFINDDNDNYKINYVKNWLSTIPSFNESIEVEIVQNELEFNYDQINENVANVNDGIMYDCIVINVPPDNNYNNSIASIKNNKYLIDKNEDLVNNINISKKESQGNFDVSANTINEEYGIILSLLIIQIL